MDINKQIVAVDDKVDVKQTLEAFVPRNIDDMVMMLNLMQFQPRGRNSFHLKNALERLLPNSEVKFTERFGKKIISIQNTETVKWKGIEFKIKRTDLIAHETSWGIVKYELEERRETFIESSVIPIEVRVDRFIEHDKLIAITAVEVVECVVEYYIRSYLSDQVAYDKRNFSSKYGAILSEPKLKTFINKIARKTFKETLADIK